MGKVIVTGGAGFIGGHLARTLIAARHEVRIIDIKNDPQYDVRDLDYLKKEFVGFDTVFHLAAIPSVPYSIDHPEVTHESNLRGTLNVLLAAKEVGVCRVIFASSAAVYGEPDKLPTDERAESRPKSPYALEKLAGELYLRLFANIYGLETVSLRYFNVYGPGQDPKGPYASVIPIFLDRKKDSRPITIFGDGLQMRDFVHVSDVVEANILAMESDQVGHGEVINVACGQGISIKEVAEIIGGEVEHAPARLEIKDSLADVSLAKELLGWTPQVAPVEGIGIMARSNE